MRTLTFAMTLFLRSSLFRTSVALAVLAFLQTGCGESDRAGNSNGNEPHASQREPLPEKGDALFTKLPPAATGVDFQNRLVLDHPLNRLYHSGFVCGGVAIGDFDGDSRPDLFFANGPESNRLFRQDADFVFQDVTAHAGVDGGDSWGTGAAVVDLEGDGDLDIYVCNYDSPNSLFLNDGTGKFREAASELGLAQVDSCIMPTFCDYDRDGDLDVFVLTNRYYREGGRPQEPPVKQTPDGLNTNEIKPEYAKYYALKQKGASSYDIDEYGRTDILLRNDGGKFTDVSAAAGIEKHGHGLSATWWDFDNDGLMDIYVANDFADPDNLFRNNGDGTFSDVITGVVNYTPWFSMGADAGDINNDGLLDFVALDMAATTHYKSKVSMGEMGALRWPIEQTKPRQVMRNCLYVSSGTGRFYESAGLSHVSSSDWSWAAKLADFDNDGRVDLFISNGMARDFNNSDLTFTLSDQIGQSEWDHYKDSPEKPEQNLTFRNRGDLEFEDVSADWGLDHVGMSYATAYGDLDRDGDLDLIVVNLNEPASIYRNEAADAHWLTVKLQGRSANREAIGGLVTVEAGGVTHVRQAVPMTGYLSSNLNELHFGLGDAKIIDSLTVRWPDGSSQTLKDVEPDQHLTLPEPGDTPERIADEVPEAMFGYFAGLRGIVHTEKIYEDFERQPLLPNKLSQLGPGIAFADVDGNGAEDFFIACPRGQSGAIFFNDGTGKFDVKTDAPFAQDSESEDMGVLFFDADSDGDVDLYVSSGSYEYDKGDPLTRDRLYLNDGAGSFSKAPEGAIPDFLDNSSCVVAADPDRDGDLDLFVGGRVISGEYPLAPNSRLLINESTPGGAVKFVEAAPEVAPGLRETGMVTAALWTDVDADGWIDLLVTHEWGAIKVFKNHEGVLTDGTEEAGLAKLLGWWNSIAGGDVDNDGDIDYAVGNVGLNTKYHASPDHPVQIYYGDYAENGTKRLVEAKFEGDTLYPGRGKSCTTSAIDHLKKKYTSYHDFAVASLEEIYTPEGLSNAVRFETNTLASGILVNDGTGKFTFHPLPNEAQTSPIFGLDLCDVDGDGNLDLYAVQNFSQPQFETPPFRGGLSLLLKGDGRGGFSSVPTSESGLLVPTDGRGLARTDLDRDGRPDFVVAVNNGELMAFRNQTPKAGRALNLKGQPGNPGAAGARVLLKRADGSQQAVEVALGGGYLSTSSQSILVNDSVSTVHVRWPNGSESDHSIEEGAGSITVAVP